MRTTVNLDSIPGSLFPRSNTARLLAWLAQHGGCLTLADLEDERTRRGLRGRS